MDKHRWWIFGFTSKVFRYLPVPFLLAACSSEISEQDQPLVEVNGYPITVGAFERSYVQTLISTGENDTPKGRFDHLDLLIDEHLWYEEALRRQLDSDSLTAQFGQLALKRAVGGRYYELEFVETLSPLSDAEVRQAFVRDQQPIMVRHLFFRNEPEANASHARLLGGQSFIAEAQQVYQTDRFDSTAGWLGEIRYFQVDDAFAEMAFSLPIDSFSSPTRSRQGWHIIKVEDRLSTPIITESEFQTRKDGIKSLVKIRKRRLEGDRFVRSFMSALDIQVLPQGVRSLTAALGRLTNSSITLDHSFDTAPLPLTPDTPLATFTINGVNEIFTADDYFFWLPELPLSEASTNPSASLGRAIRNEAFALAGLNLGLEQDKIVIEDIESSIRTYLANSMRQLESNSTMITDLRLSASIHVDSTLFQEIMKL